MYINYFGIFTGLFLIFIGFKKSGFRLLKKSYFWIIFMMLIVIMVNYFGINPFLEALKNEIKDSGKKTIKKELTRLITTKVLPIFDAICGLIFVNFKFILGLYTNKPEINARVAKIAKGR